MRIIRLSIYQIDIPLTISVEQSDGSQTSLADVTVVKLVSEDGLEGWGEHTPLCHGSDPKAAWIYRKTLRGLARQIVRGEAAGEGDLGIADAMLDLEAKRLGVPAFEFLGGPHGSVRILDPLLTESRVGTSVSLAAGVHRALAEGGDIEDVTRALKFDVAEGAVVREHDRLVVPSEPGVLNEPHLGRLGHPIRVFE